MIFAGQELSTRPELPPPVDGFTQFCLNTKMQNWIILSVIKMSTIHVLVLFVESDFLDQVSGVVTTSDQVSGHVSAETQKQARLCVKMSHESLILGQFHFTFTFCLGSHSHITSCPITAAGCTGKDKVGEVAPCSGVKVALAAELSSPPPRRRRHVQPLSKVRAPELHILQDSLKERKKESLTHASSLFTQFVFSFSPFFLAAARFLSREDIKESVCV